jgi:hypothetical protein
VFTLEEIEGDFALALKIWTSVFNKEGPQELFSLLASNRHNLVTVELGYRNNLTVKSVDFKSNLHNDCESILEPYAWTELTVSRSRRTLSLWANRVLIQRIKVNETLALAQLSIGGGIIEFLVKDITIGKEQPKR